MRIPFVTEKVTDMIIRSMRASGLLADDASADVIRAVENDATEAELDNLAAGLNFGSLGGGGGGSSSAIVGNQDVDVYIDADNLPSTPHTNYFRITQKQSTSPTTDPLNELMTLSTPNAVTGSRDVDGPELIVGPRTTLSPASGLYSALRIGTSTTDHYFNLTAGPLAIDGTDPGFSLQTGASDGSSIELRAREEIQIRNLAGSLYGGWDNLSTVPLGAHFHIGDYKNEASIVFETLADDISGPSIKHFQLRTTKSTAERKLYLRGSEVSTNDSAIRVAIGGKEGETWGDPGGAHQDTTALIVSPQLGSDNRASLRLLHRSASLLANQEIFTIESDDALGLSTFMMRITRNANPIFQVDEAGNVEIDGAVSSPATDVAEWVQVEGLASIYEHGTVVVVSSNGKMEKSTMVADTKVIGVTVDPSFPAVLMGKDNGFDESATTDLGKVPTKTGSLTELVFSEDVTASFSGVSHLKVGSDIVSIDSPVYDAAKDATTVTFTGGQTVVRYHQGTSITKGLVPTTDKLAMTVCGIVPVRAITTNGTISPGVLLVSAGDGRATGAGGSPAPGTILGKALGTLTDDSSGQVTGTVKALVNLQ
jgi:hypothetical protein